MLVLNGLWQTIGRRIPCCLSLVSVWQDFQSLTGAELHDGKRLRDCVL